VLEVAFFSGGHLVPGSHLVRHVCCRTAGTPPALTIPARMFGTVCCSAAFVCHGVTLPSTSWSRAFLRRAAATAASGGQLFAGQRHALNHPVLALPADCCNATHATVCWDGLRGGCRSIAPIASVLVASTLGGMSIYSRCWPENFLARGRHQPAHVACPAVPASKHSATGTRTRVARVRAEYPNQLDYSGHCTVYLEGPPIAADQRTSNIANRTRHAWATARAPEDQQVPRFKNR